MWAAWTPQRDQKEREGGNFSQKQTQAQKRPRPAGSKGLRVCLCRPFSPFLEAFLPSPIKTLLPLPGSLFRQGLQLSRTAIICKSKGCTLEVEEHVEQEGRCWDKTQLEQARV